MRRPKLLTAARSNTCRTWPHQMGDFVHVPEQNAGPLEGLATGVFARYFRSTFMHSFAVMMPSPLRSYLENSLTLAAVQLVAYSAIPT
jgi:hypothetical protein